jgi:hypothetical protein
VPEWSSLKILGGNLVIEHGVKINEVNRIGDGWRCYIEAARDIKELVLICMRHNVRLLHFLSFLLFIYDFKIMK